MNLPRFSEPRDAERGWMELQLKLARAFASTYSPDDAWDAIRLEALDRAFGKWLETQSNDMRDVNNAINAVGIAFGSILVEKLGFSWTIAADEHGTELAVRALPNEGDVLLYPANFVSKRWERKERDFLVDAFEKTSRYVEKLRGDWEEHRKQQ